MRGRDFTCADNGMTGERVCARPCESDTIHGHECTVRRTRVSTQSATAGRGGLQGVAEVGPEKRPDRSDRRRSKLAVRADVN